MRSPRHASPTSGCFPRSRSAIARCFSRSLADRRDRPPSPGLNRVGAPFAAPAELGVGRLGVTDPDTVVCGTREQVHAIAAARSTAGTGIAPEARIRVGSSLGDDRKRVRQSGNWRPPPAYGIRFHIRLRVSRLVDAGPGRRVLAPPGPFVLGLERPTFRWRMAALKSASVLLLERCRSMVDVADAAEWAMWPRTA